MFFDKLADKNIEVHMLAGNHDTYFKNTNNVNSVDLLLAEYDNINVIDSPQTIHLNYGETTHDICMLPWICADNYENSMLELKDTPATICMGHLEVAGFAMYRGMPSHEGLDRSLFRKFEYTFSGHYHHKSTRGNINYLGCPYEMTWSDYDDPKGFHIFDTETRSLTFIQNPYRMFYKIFYDDINKTMDQVIAFNPSMYKDCYVKVVVKNKTNPYWFDLVVDKLEKCGSADIQVVEDNFNLDLETDSDIVSEAEDTMSIIRKYIEGMNIKTDNKRVENIIQNLYVEAHNIT
jgi:DNA repair exonuclease SbcCD nuclease subunit